MGPLRRVKLTELNAHLVCVLCSGYFVDATTIIECLHTFCKTCIVRYLQTSSFCPICDVQVHKTKPLLSLREDRTLQDVVFKLVPGLFHSEMNRRLKFYKEHPEAGGDKTEQSLRERRHFFHVDDQISLSLEYLPSTPSSSYSHLHGLKPLKINNGQQGRAKPVEDDKELGIKEEIKKEEVKEEQEKMSGKVIHKRYLRCPAAVQVSHLEKFIRLKFSLTPQTHKVDIMHGGDCLVGELTLLDVVYMYKWTEDAPLRLMYTVTAIPQSRKRPRPSGLRTPASTDPEAPDPKIPKTQPSLIHQQTSLQHTLSPVHPVLGRDQDAVETGILEGNGSVTNVKSVLAEEKPVSESNTPSSIPNGSPAIGIVSVPVSVNIPSLPNTILNNGIGQLPTPLPTGRRTAFTKTTPATATPRLAVPNKAFGTADTISPIMTTKEGIIPVVTAVSSSVTSSVGVSSSTITNTPVTSVLTTQPVPVMSVPRMPINGIIEPCMKNLNSSGNQTTLQPVIPTKPRLGRPPNASRVAAASMKPGVRLGDQRAPRPVASGKMLNKVHTAMNRTNPIVSSSLNVQNRINNINGPKPGAAKVSLKRSIEMPNMCAARGIENTGAKIKSALQNNANAGSQFLPNTSVPLDAAHAQSAMVVQTTTPSVSSQVSAALTNQYSPNLSRQANAVSGEVQSPSLVPTKNIAPGQQNSSPHSMHKPSDILNQRSTGLQAAQRPTNVTNAQRQGLASAVRPTFVSPTGVAPQRATVQALQSANNQSSPNSSSVSVTCTKSSTALSTTNGSPQMAVSSTTTMPGNAVSNISNSKTTDSKQISVSGSQQVFPNSTPQRSAQIQVSRKVPPNSSVSQGTPTTPVSRLSSGSASNKIQTATTMPKTLASPAPLRGPPSPAPHRAPPSPAPHRTPVSQSSNRTSQAPIPHRTPPSPAPHRAPPSPSPHRPPPSPAPHRAPPSPAPHRAPPSPAPHRAPPSPAPHRAPPSPAPHRAPPSPAPHRAPPSPAPHRAPPSPAPHRAPPSPASHRAPSSPAPHRASPNPAPHRASPSLPSQRTSPNITTNLTPSIPAGQAPPSPAGQAPGSPAFQAPTSPAVLQASGSALVNQATAANSTIQATGNPAIQETNPGQRLSQSVSVSKQSANPVMSQAATVSTSGAKASVSSTTSTTSIMASTKEVSVSPSGATAALSTNGIGNKAEVTKFTHNVAQGGNLSPNNSNVASTKTSTNMKAPKSPGRKKTSGGTSPTILSIAQSLANRQLQRTNSSPVPTAVSTSTTTTAPVASHQPYTATSNTTVYPSPVCSALVSPALAAAAYMATAYGGDASAALTDVTAMRNLITLSQTAACIRELNLAAMVQAAEAIPRPSDPAPIDLSPTSKAAPQSPLTNGRGNTTTTSPITTNTKNLQGKSGLPKTSASNADSAPTISPPTPEVTITKLPSTPVTSASTNPAGTSGKNVPALVKLTTSSTNTVSITKRPVSSNRIAVTKSPANASVRQIPNPSFLRHQSEVRNNNNVVSKAAPVSSSSSTVTTATASTKSQPSSKLANNNRATGNSPLKDTGPLPETSSILKIEHLTRSLAAPAAAAAASASSTPSFRFFDKR